MYHCKVCGIFRYYIVVSLTRVVWNLGMTTATVAGVVRTPALYAQWVSGTARYVVHQNLTAT